MLRVLFIGQCPEIAVATAAAGHRLVGVTDPPPNPDRLRQLARVSLGRERRHPLVRAALSVRAERLPGLAPDDYAALRDRCMVRGAAAVAHVLNGVEDATLRPVPQPIEGGSTERAPQLEDYALDWSLPVTELHNRARAVPRRSGVPAQIEGRAVVITGAAICPERHGDAPPGTVLSRAGNTLRIAASDGVLLVTTR